MMGIRLQMMAVLVIVQSRPILYAITNKTTKASLNASIKDPSPFSLFQPSKIPIKTFSR